ncbi:MAG TPA: hypothetical protein VGH45_06725 [Solirubrobacteraceae bacterium]
MSTADSPAARAPSHSKRRRIITDVLIVVNTILAILAIVAIWANRQLLNPENWGNTSTTLLQNPAVRTATANYLVDQLYSNVNVASLLESRLPSRLDPLAAPVAGALRNAAVQATELALSRPVVQDLWAKANRRADQALVAIVNGGNRQVSVNGNEVTLNLSSILDDVASRLGISVDLGAKLPPSAANLVIMRSDQLKLIQDAGGALKGLATILYILVPLLYVVAIAIARGRRRRTLMSVGASAIVAGLAILLARSLGVRAVEHTLVSDESVRPAVRAVASIGTNMLVEIAGAVILIGIVLVIAAWFAGPSRLATPARRWLAPRLAEHPAAAYLVVGAVLLLVFIWQPIPATGTPLGMIVFAVLAALGTEALRRQTLAEFGGPRSPPPADDANLEHLTALRQAGALTADEADAAKARLSADDPVPATAAGEERKLP